jgi:glycerate 2-kinase
MRILVVPDKFKGSLSAREVAENIATGLREVLPKARIELVPMADGGEGTAEVIGDGLGGKWVTCRAHDPLRRAIEARYVWVDERKLAVMEMSEAAGMRCLRESERDPLRASTFGVGEMLLDAMNRGAHEIMVGLGGSATNDGGLGMAQALGFRFLRVDADAIESVADLCALDRIEPEYVEAFVPSALFPAERSPRRASLHILAAADVRNPLLGDRGATRVFASQKGATPEQIELLERALTKLAHTVARDLGCDFRDEPGAGAAGGLGFGLMSFCGAKIQLGFDVVAESIGLESKIKDADVVITGEGSLDRQTLEGKTPAGVARLARNLGKRVFAIVGRASENRKVGELFDGVHALTRAGMSEQESIARAPELLRQEARKLAKALREESDAR